MFFSHPLSVPHSLCMDLFSNQIENLGKNWLQNEGENYCRIIVHNVPFGALPACEDAGKRKALCALLCDLFCRPACLAAAAEAFIPAFCFSWRSCLSKVFHFGARSSQSTPIQLCYTDAVISLVGLSWRLACVHAVQLHVRAHSNGNARCFIFTMQKQRNALISTAFQAQLC